MKHLMTINSIFGNWYFISSPNEKQNKTTKQNLKPLKKRYGIEEIIYRFSENGVPLYL